MKLTDSAKPGVINDTGKMPQWMMLCVCAIALLVSVLSWPSGVYAGDPLAVRAETEAILTGRLSVETLPPGLDRPGEYFVQNPRNGRWYSKYGIFGGVSFLVPVGLGRVLTVGPVGQLALLNAWNTALTVLLAATLFQIGRLYTERWLLAASYPLACLFATFLWNYTRAQSTELVQVLLAAVGFERLVRLIRGEGRTAHLTVVWACVACLVLTRVYYVTLVPAVCVALWGAGWRRAAWVPAVVTGIAFAAVNTVKFGAPWLSGYHAFEAGRHMPTMNPWPGLQGFLFSMQKNIWMHFGLVIVACFGARRMWKEHRREALFLLIAGVLYVVPLCTIASWAGEWGYGPRYLLFGLPLVCVAALKVRSRAVWGIVGVVLAVQMMLHWQVNRLEFFAANRLRVPLQLGYVVTTADGWPDDNAPYPGRAYFDRRPWGLICRDIIQTDGEASRHPLWETAQQLGPDYREGFRRTVTSLARHSNWFWFSGGKAE